VKNYKIEKKSEEGSYGIYEPSSLLGIIKK